MEDSPSREELLKIPAEFLRPAATCDVGPRDADLRDDGPRDAGLRDAESDTTSPALLSSKR